MERTENHEKAKVTVEPPEEMEVIKVVKRPEKEQLKNRQLDLFQHFLCNTEEERDVLSNTADLWDVMPRYSISQKRMNKLRDSNDRLPVLELESQYLGKTYLVTIQPASIKENGKYRDYYPSANEELIEDALRKLSCGENYGYFDTMELQSGVIFSLHMLRRELEKHGHARSYQEIKKSINILNRSHIRISTKESPQVEYAATYLSELMAVSWNDGTANRRAKSLVHFHPLVARSLDKLTYRQFNYQKMMELKSQLARWIHKLLVIKYTFATPLVPFEFNYSTIKRDSHLLTWAQERDNVAELENVVEDLMNANIIARRDKDVLLNKRSIVDVKYKIYPSTAFTKEVKAANKRKNNILEKTGQKFY